MKSEKTIVWVLLLVLPFGFAGIWRLQHEIDAQRESLSRSATTSCCARKTRESNEPGICATARGHLLDARGAVLRKQTRARPGKSRVALAASGHYDNARSESIDLLPFRRNLSQPGSPAGAGRPDLAMQLIQRGIQANPDYWRLYEDLGFVYYFDLKDYQKASDAFLEGSKKPNALLWMKVMAAKVAAEGESFATSMFLWKDIYDSAPDPSVKKNALQHLQLLKVKEDCKQIDALADEYVKRYGKRRHA